MQIFPLALANTWEKEPNQKMTQDAVHDNGLFFMKKMMLWTFESKIYFWNTICPCPLEIRGY